MKKSNIFCEKALDFSKSSCYNTSVLKQGESSAKPADHIAGATFA